MSASLHDQPSLLLLCLGRFWKPYWHDCFVVVFTMPEKQTALHLKLALLWPAWWVTLGLQVGPLGSQHWPKAVFLPSLGDLFTLIPRQARAELLIPLQGTAPRPTGPLSQNLEYQQRVWHQLSKTLSSIGGPDVFSVVGSEHSSRTCIYILRCLELMHQPLDTAQNQRTCTAGWWLEMPHLL